MNNKKDLLIIAASNGENLKLAKRFEASAIKMGKQCSLIDLTQYSLPLFNPRTQEENTIPEVIEALSIEMRSIPRWVVCAPEYNGSIPPIFTNSIAWLSVADSDFRNLFNGRPIALASHSGGGCMELLISLRIQLTHLGAQVVGRQVTSNNGKPAKDESINDLLKRLLQMEPLEL